MRRKGASDELRGEKKYAAGNETEINPAGFRREAEKKDASAKESWRPFLAAVPSGDSTSGLHR
jgi:hypothetical protein